MKRAITLLLALAMLLALATGCGQSTAAQSTTASAEGSDEVITEPADDVTAPEADEAEDVDEDEASDFASDAEEAPEVEELPSLSYPVSDGSVTFKMLQVYNPNASAVYGNTGDYSDALTYATLAERTGVNIEFKMLAEATFSTQIDLIIASGDTPDFYGRSLGSYDSKLQQAVEDEVVIDILPLVEENAPDLYNLMQADPDWADQLANSDGSICKIASYTQPMTTDGPFVRGDWLEELGMEVPTDLDSLTETLKAFKSEYNCSMALLLDADLGSVLDQCFNFTAMGFNDFSFQQDAPNSGKIVCSLTTDDYINYLLKLHEYFEEGIITSDFLSTHKNYGNVESKYIDGDSGVWKDDAKYTYNNMTAAREKNAKWTATAFNFAKDDYHMNSTSSSGGVGMTQLYISASCEDPELAMQFVNYGFTDEGALLVQVGEEGTTFNYNDDGSMSFTDLIINNPDGFTSSQASYVYLTDAWMPTYQLPEVVAMAYTQDVMEAYDTWTYAEGGDDAMTFPRTYMPTMDEWSEAAALKSDCLALFSSNAAKVILGDLDEAGFRAVIEEAKSCGLDRITEIYQGVFDRYTAA